MIRKHSEIFSILFTVLIMGVFYYVMLPPINVHSSLFWSFVVMAIVVYFVINSLLSASVTITRLVKGKKTNLNYRSYKLLMIIPIIIVLTLIVNHFLNIYIPKNIELIEHRTQHICILHMIYCI